MTTEPPRSTLLDQRRLFRNVPRSEIKVVLDACTEQTVIAGDEIFAEGDAGDSLWIIESGRVEVYKTIRTGVERTLGTLRTGDVFGEMSFLDGSQRSAGARAMEPSHVLNLTRGAFDKVAESHPHVATLCISGIAMTMAERLRVTNDSYREAVAAWMEATGAAALGLHRLAEGVQSVRVHLTGGTSVSGKFLELSHHPPGWSILIAEPGDHVSLVPYHAVVRIEIA